MKKIKGLLFAFVALFAFTLAMVKVNAATDYGKDAGFDYVVSTTTNENDTATFDTLPNSNVVLNVDDSIMGKIILTKKGNGKFNTGNASLVAADEWLISVPAGSAGTVTYMASSISGSRYYVLYAADGTTESQKVELGKGLDGKSTSDKSTVIPFTATDIATVDGATYLRFAPNGGEVKFQGIQIVLTTGSFEATAQRYQVSYFVPGEATAFATEDIESGETALANPTKWGYDLKGLYTDAELTTPWDKVVSGDFNVYCKYEAWDDSVFGDGTELTVDLVTRAAKNLPLAGTPTKVPNTIYTILGNVAYVEKEDSVNGVTSTHALNTGGNFSASNNVRGLMFDAPSDGKIVLYISGNGTSRKVSLYNSAGIEIDSVENVKDLQEVSFDISAAGEYRVGAGGTIHIYAAKFIPTPEVDAHIYQQEGTKDDTTFVRYITIVNGIDVEDLEYTLHVECEDVSFDANCVVATKLLNNGEVYAAEINGANYTFDEKDGTLYIICVLAVKNAEHQEFAGKEITATMTVNGATLEAKLHTISE